jgi:hypothetical protein
MGNNVTNIDVAFKIIASVTNTYIAHNTMLVTRVSSDAGSGTRITDTRGIPFASLGTQSNGSSVYCSNCTKASNPCTGASTGTFSDRINGAWVCR